MIKIQCGGEAFLELDELVEFQGELKKRTKKDIDTVAGLIEKYGFSFPFFVWKNNKQNKVLDGHGRILALRKIRESGKTIPALPVCYIQAKDEAEAKKKLLHLNSQYGQMTAKSVMEFADGIALDFNEFNLSDGASLSFEKEGEEETVGDDEAPEVQKEAVSKLGEIYDLGEHRLMCGDSTDAEQVELLMGGELADIWITDPPYNVAYTGKTKESLKIMNDKQSDEGFRLFLINAFNSAVLHIKEGAVFYIWHADSEGFNFRYACKEAGLEVRQCLIWNKNGFVMGRQDYQWKHEPCLYGWKGGASHLWASDRKQTTVIDYQKPNRSGEHPTMKPVGLFEYQILNNTKGQDIVLDTFGGSGTTIIASAKNNRRCRMMELDPIYCDVIRRRWTKWATENGKVVGSGCLE